MSAPPPEDFSAYLDSLGNLGIEPSLAGIEAVCRALGDPQEKYDVIQVTGTNGKTSTSRMIQALLSAHGIKCGLYLSPHLESYRERVSVNGVEIDEGGFEELGRSVREKITAVEESLGGRRVTQFEVITAAAFAYFERRGVRVAVVEVGMGGRWDATSVAVPKVAVITNVTMDHADWLGPALTDIAGEKSYVIRAGNTVVVGPAAPEIRAIFERRAVGEKAKLIVVGEDARVEADEHHAVAIETPKAVYGGIRLGVAGHWQERNAVTALAAAEAYVGQALNIETTRRALAQVRSPGRAELIEGAPEILLDGAHNQSGVDALSAHLRLEYADRNPVLVVSILRDKAAPVMVETLDKAGREIIFTDSGNPRCLDPYELSDMAAGEAVTVTVEPDPALALEMAKDLAGEKGLVVVTGSLYLVGVVRKLLRNQGVAF